jgi:hypothetical protein
MSAWVVFQRNVARLSIAAICALAAQEPIRRDDGSYAPTGGLGRPLAQSTDLPLAGRGARVVPRGVPQAARHRHGPGGGRPPRAPRRRVGARGSPLPEGSPPRHNALDRYLRVLESRRKLLGLDQPVRVELTADITSHDDPASTKLAEAMADAKQRRDELMADAS